MERNERLLQFCMSPLVFVVIASDQFPGQVKSNKITRESRACLSPEATFY